MHETRAEIPFGEIKKLYEIQEGSSCKTKKENNLFCLPFSFSVFAIGFNSVKLGSRIQCHRLLSNLNQAVLVKDAAEGGGATRRCFKFVDIG